jgi:hypothetical protein
MILNFLQTRDPPILPALHNLPYRVKDQTTGKPSESGFADDIRRLAGYGSENKESLGQLLFHFFRKYGHELDYEKHVISVRRGRLLTREEKNWHLAGLQKEARNRLCVEEPFNTERNLGNSADEFSWRGVHLELRRAFGLLADGQHLDKACEQYEFPPEPEKEKSTVFQKPKSTKPTLTSSVPARNGRNGGLRGGGGGGRGGFNGKGNGSYGRRSSSSASFGANRPPFLHSPPINAMNGPDYFPRDFPRGLNEQLHDQLFQQYQMLEMQSNSLRQQLAAQQRAQQAQVAQAAHMHAQAVAHAQAQHNRGPSSTNGSPQKSPYVNGRSSPHMTEAGLGPNPVPNFLYHYPGFFDPTQGSAIVSQDGPRTNPSSPSLTHSIPGLRRQVHRASNASDTASIRSHSQPARGVPQQGSVPGYAPTPLVHDHTTFAGYPIVSSSQEPPSSQPATDAQYNPLSANPELVAHADHGTPKEYVGYYVDEQSPPRPLQEYSVSHYPSLTELAQRRRRISAEITQPLLNAASRRISRSPSPLGGHVRSYSTSVAPFATANVDTRRDRIDSTRPPADNGPLIANGSFPTQPRESRSRSGTVDAPVPDVINPAAVGIFLNEQYKTVAPEQRKQLMLEEMQRQKTEELMGITIANGTTARPMKKVPPVDMNGLSQVPSGDHRPSFPPLPDAWVNYEMNNGNRANQLDEVSPTRTQPAQWRPIPPLNALSALDTLNAPRPPPQEIKSATLPLGPLLSPVIETRTPSPNHTRQQDAGKFANGTKPNAKENAQQPRRASHSATHASATKDNRTNGQKGNSPGNEKSKASGGNNSVNSWQQPGRNKNKKKKASSKTNEQKPSGEPLPANVADRKGG